MHDLVESGELLQWQVVVQSDQPSVKLRSENVILLKGKQGKGFGFVAQAAFAILSTQLTQFFCIKGTLLVKAKIVSSKRDSTSVKAASCPSISSCYCQTCLYPLFLG